MGRAWRRPFPPSSHISMTVFGSRASAIRVRAAAKKRLAGPLDDGAAVEQGLELAAADSCNSYDQRHCGVPKGNAIHVLKPEVMVRRRPRDRPSSKCIILLPSK